MKKKALALSLALLVLLSLAACGASASSGEAMTGPAAPEDEAYYSSNQKYAGGVGTSASDIAAEAPAGTPNPTDGAGGGMLSDKIIYSAYAEIETQAFEASVEGVYDLVDRYGGFLQSSSVTGNDYAASRSARSADFVIRIPSDHFEAMTGSLSQLGNVPVLTTNADNITKQYNDTQSRLDAYQIEYDRLLAMLEKAETVEDMLSIEERLSDVRYNIESLSNTISSWDSQIDYSTVELRMNEVVIYTENPETSYWDSVGHALNATLAAIGDFFKWLLKAVIAISPALAVVAVIAVPVAVIVRHSIRRRAAKSAAQDKTEKGGKAE